MRKIQLLILVVLLATEARAQQTDDAVVASLFPGTLALQSTRFTRAPVRSYHFERADLDGTGRNFIVAVYTNGFASVVDVIRLSPAGGVVVGSSDGFRLIAGVPSIQLRDLDGDGRPEIIVGLRFNKGGETWIFQWNGGTLKSLTPLDADEHYSMLRSPVIADIDGDGMAEIFEAPSLDDASDEEPMYGLSGGAYRPRTSIRFWYPYTRGTGEPEHVATTFAGVSGSGDFEVRIINGDDLGDHRTSSALLKLNGSVIAGPDEFKRKARAIVVPVTLNESNSVEVEMRGDPGSQISVVVERISLRSAPTRFKCPPS